MAFFAPLRPSYRADPYPALAALRREDPVHWSAELQAWVVTRYVDCGTVLRDGTRFTSDPALAGGAQAESLLAHRAAVPLGMVPNLGTTSGRPHRSLRNVVNPVFTRQAVAHLEAVITGSVRRLLDAVPEGRPFEFMAGFAQPLPRLAILAAVGCPAEQEERLQQALLTIELTRTTPGPTAASLVAARSAESDAGHIVDLYRSGLLPSNTVLGALMPAGGEPRSAAEVTSVVAQIATVGAEPTIAALGNAVLALATHPGAAARLRAEPAGVSNAVHELLRFDSPTHIIPRFAARDGELAGKRVRRGDTVLAVVGAANRDPAEFPDPDTLDWKRDARRQLAFGQGEHFCLGGALALLILQVALSGLIRQFGHIELAAPPRYGGGVLLRRPDSLYLTCS